MSIITGGSMPGRWRRPPVHKSAPLWPPNAVSNVCTLQCLCSTL